MLATSLFVISLSTGVGADDAAAGPQIPCSDPRGCPDLVVDPETMNPHVQVKKFKANHCAVVEGMTQAGTRELLKFTFTTPNFGAGDLIVGSPDASPEFFEFSECHGHYHFKEYADYRLWTPAGFAQWDALRTANPDILPGDVLAANPGLLSEFVAGEKRGFCVIDVVLYDIAAPKYLLCDFQGISVGWADEYSDDLDGQWIDITGVASGDYILEQEVNAERVYEESDYANNRASVPVTI